MAGTSDQTHDPLYAFTVTIDTDTLYLHESIKTHNWRKFRIAMQKEIDDRMEGRAFSVQKSQIPKTAIVLSAV